MNADFTPVLNNSTDEIAEQLTEIIEKINSSEAQRPHIIFAIELDQPEQIQEMQGQLQTAAATNLQAAHKLMQLYHLALATNNIGVIEAIKNTAATIDVPLLLRKILYISQQTTRLNAPNAQQFISETEKKIGEIKILADLIATAPTPQPAMPTSATEQTEPPLGEINPIELYQETSQYLNYLQSIANKDVLFIQNLPDQTALEAPMLSDMLQHYRAITDTLQEAQQVQENVINYIAPETTRQQLQASNPALAANLQQLPEKFTTTIKTLSDTQSQLERLCTNALFIKSQLYSKRITKLIEMASDTSKDIKTLQTSTPINNGKIQKLRKRLNATAIQLEHTVEEIQPYLQQAEQMQNYMHLQQYQATLNLRKTQEAIKSSLTNIKALLQTIVIPQATAATAIEAETAVAIRERKQLTIKRWKNATQAGAITGIAVLIPAIFIAPFEIAMLGTLAAFLSGTVFTAIATKSTLAITAAQPPNITTTQTTTSTSTLLTRMQRSPHMPTIGLGRIMPAPPARDIVELPAEPSHEQFFGITQSVTYTATSQQEKIAAKDSSYNMPASAVNLSYEEKLARYLLTGNLDIINECIITTARTLHFTISATFDARGSVYNVLRDNAALTPRELQDFLAQVCLKLDEKQCTITCDRSKTELAPIMRQYEDKKRSITPEPESVNREFTAPTLK